MKYNVIVFLQNICFIEMQSHNHFGGTLRTKLRLSRKQRTVRLRGGARGPGSPFSALLCHQQVSLQAQIRQLITIADEGSYYGSHCLEYFGDKSSKPKISSGNKIRFFFHALYLELIGYYNKFKKDINYKLNYSSALKMVSYYCSLFSFGVTP